MARLSLVIIALPLLSQVQITQGRDFVSVQIDGKPYTQFIYGADVTKPYLHPIRSATGTIITRRYPMEKVEGESTDHMEHRGLWFSHSDVNGFNFYANEKSFTTANRGTIVVRTIDKILSGKDEGWIEATLGWLDPDAKTILIEKRKMVFHSGKLERVMDFDFTLTAVVQAKFGDHRDGVFSIRVADPLQETHTGVMSSANGCTQEKECWGRRSDWMDYSGTIDAEKVGVAIFDHPENPGHPTYWQARGYGLFAANIFGTNYFTHGQLSASVMILAPGQSIRFRYRIVIHSGNAASAGIGEQYETYVKTER